MTMISPDGPYIYQPHGVTEEPYSIYGRLFGIGGVSRGICIIDGLTKEEATVICATLRKLYNKE